VSASRSSSFAPFAPPRTYRRPIRGSGRDSTEKRVESGEIIRRQLRDLFFWDKANGSAGRFASPSKLPRKEGDAGRNVGGSDDATRREAAITPHDRRSRNAEIVYSAVFSDARQRTHQPTKASTQSGRPTDLRSSSGRYRRRREAGDRSGLAGDRRKHCRRSSGARNQSTSALVTNATAENSSAALTRNGICRNDWL
jgi:hypothetical protein